MRKSVKRIFSLALALGMALCLIPAASAAGSVTWSKNTSLTAKVNKYTNAVVGEGVAVTLKYSGDPNEPTGLWITKSLTVKTGGSIGGSGILILEQGAAVTGLDLYYKVGSQVKKLKNGAETLWDSGVLKNAGDTGNFAYDSSAKLWCLTGYTFESDPFDRGTDENVVMQHDFPAAMDCANRLYRLRLFKGVGTFADGGVNFDLQRPATRAEALVMLIRLLGKEDEALSGDWEHPFTDAGWADKYIGYAYEKGLTKGVSAAKFGTATDASAQMFLTFVLGALGYDDAAGDFSWSTPEKLAEQVGILPDGVVLDDFLRSDAALVSEAALTAKVKDSGNALCDILMYAGVFTEGEYKTVY